MKPKRVAIFQAKWPLQTQTVNLVCSFIKSGMEVDLFLYKTSDFVDIESLNDISGLRVYHYSEVDKGEKSFWLNTKKDFLKQRRLFSSILEKSPVLLNWIPFRVKDILKTLVFRIKKFQGDEIGGVIPLKFVMDSYSITKENKYQCCIGIEKHGLIWAGKIAKLHGCPYLYFSLELYTWDYPETKSSVYYRRIKALEQDCHSGALATIIQDKRRENVLYKDHHILDMHTLYLPVSINGGVVRAKSDWFHKIYGLDSQDKVILQFGMISEQRLSFELAKTTHRFSPKWKLVFHGYGQQDVLDKVLLLGEEGKIVLSTDRVPAEMIPSLIQSALIGIVLYSPEPINDYLTAFASEKLALYLQSGLPVITFDYPGYDVIIQEHAGIIIHEIQDIPGAIEKIFSNYEEYCEGAFACFEKYYSFEKNVKGIIDFVASLGPSA